LARLKFKIAKKKEKKLQEKGYFVGCVIPKVPAVSTLSGKAGNGVAGIGNPQSLNVIDGATSGTVFSIAELMIDEFVGEFFLSFVWTVDS
jgi:hypothetical protein